MPEYMAEYMPENWIITGALLGVLLLATLSWLVSRSRLSRLREAAMYVIGETDRRVGLAAPRRRFSVGGRTLQSNRAPQLAPRFLSSHQCHVTAATFPASR